MNSIKVMLPFVVRNFLFLGIIDQKISNPSVINKQFLILLWVEDDKQHLVETTSD